MDRVELRDATAEDVGEILNFWATEAHGRSISDDADSLRRAIAHPTSSCLVAVANGRIVGSLLAGWDSRRFSLYRLAVSADHRRKGVGHGLVEEAVRRATTVGASRVDAMVAAENEEAATFWVAMGFHPNPRYLRWERRPYANRP